MTDPNDLGGRAAPQPVTVPVPVATTQTPVVNLHMPKTKAGWIWPVLGGCGCITISLFLLTLLTIGAIAAWHYLQREVDGGADGNKRPTGEMAKVFLEYRDDLPVTLDKVGRDILKGKTATRTAARDQIHGVNLPVWKMLDERFRKVSDKDGTITDTSIGQDLIDAGAALRKAK